MSSGPQVFTGLPAIEQILAENAPYAVPLDPMITDVRPFVSFNPDGRIRMSGSQPVGLTEAAIRDGALYALGDGDLDLLAGLFRNWVEWTEDGWRVVPRPALAQAFDTREIVTGQEAVLANLPPARVTFTGPVSGEQPHTETGDLRIGWRVPGTYVVSIDPFPYLPLSFTFQVSKP